MRRWSATGTVASTDCNWWFPTVFNVVLDDVDRHIVCARGRNEMLFDDALNAIFITRTVNGSYKYRLLQQPNPAISWNLRRNQNDCGLLLRLTTKAIGATAMFLKISGGNYPVFSLIAGLSFRQQDQILCRRVIKISILAAIEGFCTKLCSGDKGFSSTVYTNGGSVAGLYRGIPVQRTGLPLDNSERSRDLVQMCTLTRRAHWEIIDLSWIWKKI